MKKKILVVDDEQDILIILKAFLERDGYHVKATTTCEEGLDIFYGFKPDIVLLDVNVGTSDGREMCRKIKSNAEHSHIPVILISANSYNLSNYNDYGANGTLEKPFNFPHLLTLIAKTVSPN